MEHPPVPQDVGHFAELDIPGGTGVVKLAGPDVKQVHIGLRAGARRLLLFQFCLVPPGRTHDAKLEGLTPAVFPPGPVLQTKPAAATIAAKLRAFRTEPGFTEGIQTLQSGDFGQPLCVPIYGELRSATAASSLNGPAHDRFPFELFRIHHNFAPAYYTQHALRMSRIFSTRCVKNCILSMRWGRKCELSVWSM